MKTLILSIHEPGAISQAEKALYRSQLVAFPTDTVYGLGALVNDPQAIDQLYAVKGRDTSKAIAVLIGSVVALAQVSSEMGEVAKSLAEHFWPGPLTLVVPRHPLLPKNLSPSATIGVRMPNHPFALELLNRVGPLAVTSANLSGKPSPNTAQEVLAQLEGLIPLIFDDGHTPGGIPSTVVDCTGSELIILRQGSITESQLLTGF
jgi:L-threonylcarbamoyladenylate synthase